MSTISANKKSIGEIISNQERRRIKLPIFQRSYSWEKTQISTLWADLKNFLIEYQKRPIEASYFIGPIVVINSSTEIVILDGQQRLATSIIFLATLRDLARKIVGQEGNDLARDIQRSLIEKESQGSFSLALNRLDEPFFLATIKSDPPKPALPALRSHKLIQGAYKYFFEEIGKFIDNASPSEKIEWIKLLKDSLTKGTALVVIEVQSEEDAYSIFETLNDRGLRLSVPDLVLNLLMKNCKQESEREIVRDKWNYILQQMGKRDISRFLRHMWISNYGDIKAHGLYTEIKEFLNKHKVSSTDFSESCSNECDDYIKLLEIDKSLPKLSLSNLEGIIKYLGFHSAIPLLLSGMRCLHGSDFTKLSYEIVSLYIRYSLISNLNPLDLESAIFEAARIIRAEHRTNSNSRKCLASAMPVLRKLNPLDSVVKNNLEEFNLLRSEAIWFLTQLAKKVQSKTKEIGMDDANLEHIFPLNPGSNWPNRAELDPLVWHLGNLTILGTKLNNDAKNKSFADKCKLYYSKSEIRMTKEILNYKKWEKIEVINRSNSLGDKIVDLWK